jgi:hypothetical protein
VPRNSISRRVARAASIGGSRSYRQRTPLGWYSILLLVCVVGLGLIVFSRHEREVASENATTTTTTTTQPTSTPPTASDHFEAALSVDVCGKVFNLPRSKDLTSGIITDGNGVVDIQPARAGKDAKQYEGANATLAKFLTQEGVDLTISSLKLPKSLGSHAGTYVNGEKCGTKSAVTEVVIWPSTTSTTPYSGAFSPGITFASDGLMYMVDFLPRGTSVPKPLAAHLVAEYVTSLTTTTTTTAPKSGTTTTTKPGTATTTTKPGGTTTTTKPSSTSTTSTTGASSTTTTTG